MLRLTEVACLFLMLLTVLPVRGQGGATATLTGTIVDATDSFVPKATITVKNTRTSLLRQTATGEAGGFVVPFLPPGDYTLRVERVGFRPLEVHDVHLEISDQVAIKLRLDVETTAATVTVVAGAATVEESGTLATVVNRTFVSNQPLNGRSFQTLIGMAPGVVFTPSNVVTGGQFSVNGQRSSTNYFTVDGVSTNFGLPMSQNLYDAAGGSIPSVSAQGSTSAIASVDAVEEFAAQTSTFAPEFGRTPGAQISIVTRSGTNDLHGSAFDYLRNNKLDANNWFGNRNGVPRPPLRQNDYGLTLGGPFRLPRYDGRNRTFFFLSWEGLRLRQPQVSNPVLVPTFAARQQAAGDVRAILNAFPLPNRSTPAPDPNSAVFIGSYSNPSSLDAGSIRVDHSCVPLVLDDPNAPGGKRFNFAAFSVPPNGQQGTMGRHVLRGFGLSQLDLSVRQQIHATEKLSLQIRAEAFNVFNHPNFASPEGRLNNPNFGVSTQMFGSPVWEGCRPFTRLAVRDRCSYL